MKDLLWLLLLALLLALPASLMGWALREAAHRQPVGTVRLDTPVRRNCGLDAHC